MSKSAIHVGAIFIVIASGCGMAESSEPASSTASSTDLRTIYFLTDNGRASVGVERALKVEHSDGDLIRSAVDALLAGPTEEERANGVTTAIPRESNLRSVTFRGRGGQGVVVDLTGLALDDDALTRARVITQVARSVLGLSVVDRLWLRADGAPWDFWWMHGGVIDRHIDDDSLPGYAGICEAKPGTEAMRGDCFK